jgi:hypothetical protein
MSNLAPLRHGLVVMPLPPQKSATPDDFAQRLLRLLKEREKAMFLSIEKKRYENNSKGMEGSPQFILDFWEEAVRDGIDIAFKECNRIVLVGTIPFADLRKITEEQLIIFLTSLRESFSRTSFQSFTKSIVERYLENFDQHLEISLREFDTGLLETLPSTMPPIINNHLNIGEMSGGSIQQGTQQSQQLADNTGKSASAKAAPHFFEALKSIFSLILRLWACAKRWTTTS